LGTFCPHFCTAGERTRISTQKTTRPIARAVIGPHKKLPMAYDTIDAATLSAVVSASPAAQEEVWANVVVRGSNDYSPLYDNLTGREGSGKAFIQKDDMRVKAGNEVHINLVGGARSRGIQGGTERVGRGKNLKTSDFSFKVGRWWDGVKMKSIVANETKIGSTFDRTASMVLRRNLGIKKTDDMIFDLIVHAGARNTLRPNNKGSQAALRSADYFQTTTVTAGKSMLSANGAKPIKLGRSSAGHDIKKFMFMNTQFGLESMLNSSAFIDGVTNADERGALNSLFTGNIPNWMGQPIYQWDVEDPEEPAPAGCPLLPRAFLGVAITAGSSAVTVYGGGNATDAADTDIPYFGYFSNAAVVGCEGTKRAADTTTERYFAIKHIGGSTPGAIMYASFKVNDGNKLTMFKRLGPSAAGDQVTTLGGITWGTGTYGTNEITLADSAPEGSLIVECNEYGVPLCYGLGLGEQAGVMGHGSIDGQNAIGLRTIYTSPHGTETEIGIETVFGARAFERLDGLYGNYILIESACPLAGFPIVA
jgi:hypothetical protein